MRISKREVGTVFGFMALFAACDSGPMAVQPPVAGPKQPQQAAPSAPTPQFVGGLRFEIENNALEVSTSRAEQALPGDVRELQYNPSISSGWVAPVFQTSVSVTPESFQGGISVKTRL